MKSSARSLSPLRDPLILAAMLLVGLMLSWLSVARYQGYNAGMFDLGNMAQAIWSGSQGAPLLYSKPAGVSASRLAGHVELIYFLWSLPYMLWPDPRLLLVGQALLFVLGALPVYRMALRHSADLGPEEAPRKRFAARCLALSYLLYPTALTSVLFDFHADTLAMPLLLFMLDALDEGVWWRYALWGALALSCKFYVALPVALIGAYAWLWGGRRRVGLLTAAAAVLYGALAFFVIRRLFNDPVSTAETGGYVNYYFGQIAMFGATLGDRFLSAVVVFGPVLLIAWRGWRWLLPGVPVAAAALVSSGPGGAYDYRYHHYAIVVPFIIMAAIVGVELYRRSDAARKASAPAARRRSGRSWRGDLGMSLAIVLIFTVLLVDTPLNPLYWVGLPGQGRDPSVYGVLPRDAMKDRFLQQIPADAPLAASNQLAPHLASRSTLYLLRYPDEQEGPRRLPQNLAQVQYAVADGLFDLYLPVEGGYGGGLDGDREAIGVLLRDRQMGLVAARDGLLLFQRAPQAERVLTNTLELLQDDGAAAEQQFGAQVALVRHSIAPIGPRRWRASFTWRLTGDFPQGGRFVAVSRLDGLADARIVHVPTYALLPAWEWKPGQLVSETFDVELPADAAPGSYRWMLGWYDVGLPSSYATDARSRLRDSQEAAVDTLEVR